MKKKKQVSSSMFMVNQFPVKCDSLLKQHTER